MLSALLFIVILVVLASATRQEKITNIRHKDKKGGGKSVFIHR